jgi:hypothetical protein
MGADVTEGQVGDARVTAALFTLKLTHRVLRPLVRVHATFNGCSWQNLSR